MSARVMVVDDNPTNLKLATALLEVSGYDVTPAHDAESAWDAVRASPPQLILLDLQLPGMDGFTFARKLKSDPATSGIRIVALSAHATTEHTARAKEAGFEGFLTKPIEADAFLAQVSALLAP